MNAEGRDRGNSDLHLANAESITCPEIYFFKVNLRYQYTNPIPDILIVLVRQHMNIRNFQHRICIRVRFIYIGNLNIRV